MEPQYILILINWVVYCQLLQQQETPRRSSPLPCLVTSLSLSLSLPKSRREPSQLFVSFWRGFPLVFGNPWLRENGNSFYVILSCTGQTRHPQKTHRKWVFGFLWRFSHDKNIIKHIIVIHYSSTGVLYYLLESWLLLLQRLTSFSSVAQMAVPGAPPLACIVCAVGMAWFIIMTLLGSPLVVKFTVGATKV